MHNRFDLNCMIESYFKDNKLVTLIVVFQFTLKYVCNDDSCNITSYAACTLFSTTSRVFHISKDLIGIDR